MYKENTIKKILSKTISIAVFNVLALSLALVMGVFISNTIEICRGKKTTLFHTEKQTEIQLTF